MFLIYDARPPPPLPTPRIKDVRVRKGSSRDGAAIDSGAELPKESLSPQEVTLKPIS